MQPFSIPGCVLAISCFVCLLKNAQINSFINEDDATKSKDLFEDRTQRSSSLVLAFCSLVFSRPKSSHRCKCGLNLSNSSPNNVQFVLPLFSPLKDFSIYVPLSTEQLCAGAFFNGAAL